MLKGCEYVQAMLLVLGEPIELESSSVDAMLGLFGYHCLVWRQVQVVSASAEFFKMMVLCGNLGVKPGLYISSESDGLS